MIYLMYKKVIQKVIRNIVQFKDTCNSTKFHMKLADCGKPYALLEISVQNKTTERHFFLWAKKNLLVDLYLKFKAHRH